MPTFHQSSMFARLRRRKNELDDAYNKIKEQIEQGILGDEEGRLWLENQIRDGKGLNICVGDFPIGESLGVDFDHKKIGLDIWANGVNIPADSGVFDYVVTNYLEYFPNTLEALREWNRVLKYEGRLALVCCSATSYNNPMGPLANRRRLNCFSTDTLQFYLERAGFNVIRLEYEKQELRVVARKVKN